MYSTVIIQWIGKNHKRIMTKLKNCRFGFFGHNINKVMLENRIQLRAKAAKLFRRSLVFFKKKCNQQGWKRETDSCIHVVSICEVHTYACTIVWCSCWFVPNQDNSPFFSWACRTKSSNGSIDGKMLSGFCAHTYGFGNVSKCCWVGGGIGHYGAGWFP